MSDLISREALLEEIKENHWGWFSREMLLLMLENQPSVTDTNVGSKWIPCSERLPEEDGEYLAWIRYDGHEFMTIEDFECSGLLAQWNFKGRNDDEVIAWMPLPEAYKGE